MLQDITSITSNKKKEKQTFFSYLLIFFMVYFSNSSMASVLYLNSKIINIGYFLLIVTVMFYMVISHKINGVNKKSTLILIVMFINIFLTMLFNQDYTYGYYVVIMSLMGAYCISNIFNRQDFYEIYIKVIVFISVFSLISTYVIIPFFSFIMNTLPTYTNENNVTYLNMFFSMPIINDGFYRNNGIYLEPGMYQVFLTFGLIAELMLINRRAKALNITSILIALITTFSPAAYIQTLILLFAFIINKDNKPLFRENKEFIISILITLIILYVMFTLSPNAFGSFINGFYKFKYKESSYQGRTASIWANLKIGIENPILGCGISNGFKSIFENYLGNITSHNTSTTTVLFSIFGVCFPLMITYMQFKIAFIKKNKLISNILVFIVMVLSINSQLLIYNQMFYIYYFSCFMEDLT